jgi:hypothetical protein
MRKPSFLGVPSHPWLFIEEAAMREVEKDFESGVQPVDFVQNLSFG